MPTSDVTPDATEPGADKELTRAQLQSGFIEEIVQISGSLRSNSVETSMDQLAGVMHVGWFHAIFFFVLQV